MSHLTSSPPELPPHLNYALIALAGYHAGGSKIFHTRAHRSRGPPIVLYNGYPVFPGATCDRGIMLITRLLQQPRLRMEWSYTYVSRLCQHRHAMGRALQLHRTYYTENIVFLENDYRITLCKRTLLRAHYNFICWNHFLNQFRYFLYQKQRAAYQYAPYMFWLTVIIRGNNRL